MISICIATYNGEKYIKDQLLSILPQLDEKDEVVISDDHSTDNTLEVIRSLKDVRIKICYNDRKNKGYTNNFQNAINKSIGDYVFLSDQDDVWVNNKISTMMEFLKDYHFVASDAEFVDNDLQPLGETYFKRRGGGNDSFLSNLIKTKYLGCCIAFNRVILEKALPFPKRSILCPHDFWLTLIATFYYKTYVVNDPLVLYRRHSNNVSIGGAKSSTSVFFKFQFRSYALYQVLSRAAHKKNLKNKSQSLTQ